MFPKNETFYGYNGFDTCYSYDNDFNDKPFRHDDRSYLEDKSGYRIVEWSDYME